MVKETLKLMLLAGVLLLPVQAYATTVQPKEVLQDLQAALQEGDEEAARYYLTNNSQDIFNRFWGYQLQGCIPTSANYMGERQQGRVVFVKAGSENRNNIQYTELAFVEENGQWKMDVPESLRVAWGNQWQDRLTQMELLYLTLQSQMGGHLDCKALQGLVQVQ